MSDSQKENPHVERYERVYRPLRRMLYYNFLGGMAWAAGVTIGLSLIFIIATFVANQVNFVPIVGDFLSQVLDYIIKNNVHLQTQ